MSIKAGFERISKYADDEGVIVPYRKTKNSAGYDFYVAEDTVVPSYDRYILHDFEDELIKDLGDYYRTFEEFLVSTPYDLATVATFTKKYGKKTTLVPTGVKAYMPEGYYLQLSMRSSLPNKHWIMIANAPGIIDADYYNNPDNEGHIYFQLVNFLPFDVILKKGDCIGQGIFLPYGVIENDSAEGERTGGFGSTNENPST